MAEDTVEITTLPIKVSVPCGPEHVEHVTTCGQHYVEIAPAGTNANYQTKFGHWLPCDPTQVNNCTGSSGRTRSVYTAMPLTVGVRTDAEAEELVTLRLSSDPSKASEIAISLLNIEDAGPGVEKRNRPQNCTLNEHEVAGQVIHKHDQSIHVVDQNTLRLLTPKLRPIASRSVTYAVTVPAGYEISMGENWPEIHGPAGYLRTLRTALLDVDMQPVCDAEGMPLDAISLAVVAHGQDEAGRQLYTLTKTSKIDLSTVEWAWFDVELSGVSYGGTTIGYKYSWPTVHNQTAGQSVYATASTGYASVQPPYSGGSYYYIYRYFLAFNTAAVAAGARQMFLKLYTDAGTGYDNSALTVQRGTQNPEADIAAADFDAFADAAYATAELMAYSTNSIEIPVAALNNSPSTGFTSFCVRNKAYDYDNQTPPTTAGTTPSNYGSAISTPRATDDSHKPKLILVYANSGNRGEGTLLQVVEIPYGASALANNTFVPAGATGDNNATRACHMYRSSTGVFYANRVVDGINTATVNVGEISAGRYILVNQWSAVTGQMRCGIYNPTAKTLTWGDPAAYRGFFPIHSSNKLRWGYGLGNLPIGIGPWGLYDTILSDAEIAWACGSYDI